MLGLTTAATAAVLAFGGLSASSALASAGSLNGAGSTLVNPLMQDWVNGDAANVTVAYNPVGSGTGITDLINKLVDFAGSDAPLTATQQTNCNNAQGSTCVMMPWGLTATGVSFNLPGISYVKLTGIALAQIYLGVIKTWNDPALKALNPGVNLPATPINPVFRSDGSGDSYAFTQYLSKVSTTWASKVGFSTSPTFPAGVGEKGNAGIASEIKSTVGSIGYLSASYIIANGLTVAEIKNAAGKYEFPNLKNIANAASSVKHVPANNVLSITNPPKAYKIAYPISTFTYCIVPQHGGKGSLVKQFVDYAVSSAGQAFGAGLDFASLPAAIVKADQNTAATLS
jgi:phosphate transport system substrate-binding protein